MRRLREANNYQDFSAKRSAYKKGFQDYRSRIHTQYNDMVEKTNLVVNSLLDDLRNLGVNGSELVFSINYPVSAGSAKYTAAKTGYWNTVTIKTSLGRIEYNFMFDDVLNGRQPRVNITGEEKVSRLTDTEQDYVQTVLDYLDSVDWLALYKKIGPVVPDDYFQDYDDPGIGYQEVGGGKYAESIFRDLAGENKAIRIAARRQSSFASRIRKQLPNAYGYEFWAKILDIQGNFVTVEVSAAQNASEAQDDFDSANTIVIKGTLSDIYPANTYTNDVNYEPSLENEDIINL